MKKERQVLTVTSVRMGRLETTVTNASSTTSERNAKYSVSHKSTITAPLKVKNYARNITLEVNARHSASQMSCTAVPTKVIKFALTTRPAWHTTVGR